MITTTIIPRRIQNVWISSLFLLSALLTIHSSEAQNVLTQDTAKCFSSLSEADANGDLKLDKTEYPTFLKLYGVPDIPDMYQDLPLVLQSTFFSISCICSTNGEETESCCFGFDPYIPIEGAVAVAPTQAQEIYLGRLCGLTDSAVVQIIPTPAPVVTAVPSSSPTFASSKSPSMSPTASKGPSNVPTLVPTNLPSATNSQSPSTLTPTPGASPMVTKIQTQYTIAIANGRADQINPEWFTQDLISAMDVVATEVGILVEDTTGTRRRRLTVTVGIPTSIVEFAEKEWSNDSSSACPAALANTDADSCQQVTASVDLFVDENQSEVPSLFGTVLEEEIEAGRLEEALLLIDPETPVTILAGKGQRSIGPMDDEEPVEPSRSGLSTGALIGIGAAGAALLAVCIITLSKSSKRQTKDRSTPRRQDDGKFVEATPSEELKMAQKEVGSGLEWQAPRPTADEGDEEQPNMNENPWVKKKKDDGSVVSDAGWSDAYSSSMGTNESDDDREISSPSKTIEGTENVGDAGSANLEELEAAIQSENWAAVGASAAVMAANQYETDSQTNSKSSRGVDSSVQSSINRRELDTEKTQELDNLIQSGDWEGVIQAAARFEAELGQGDQSATVFEDSDSRSDSKESSRSGSFTIGSQFSSIQQSSAASGAGSRATPNQAQADFRREVQELVNKVVPEEADHVDDMIEQFKGRENELLETLRTMQERNIAQKARKAEQQRAKIEAKQMVKQARKEQTNADPGESLPEPAGGPASAPIPAPVAPTPTAAAETTTKAPAPVQSSPVRAPRTAAPAPVSMSTPPVTGGHAPMVQTPSAEGVAPMTQEPTPFPAPVATPSMPAPAEAPANTEDEAAAAAADWAIAQALSNLEKEQSSLEDRSYVIPDEDFDDEGSL